MRKITFTVDKTNTGFDAYYTNKGKIVIVTVGDNISDLKDNILEAYDLYADYENKKVIRLNDIALMYDLE